MTSETKTASPCQPTFAALAAQAVVMLAVLTLITGVAYPLAVTAIAKVAFPDQANGSLIMRDGKVIGSKLVGQPFEDPKHFWGRLSATTPAAYNARASTGSNLGPTNEALTKSAKARVEALRAADLAAGVDDERAVPVDLVTSSASGLDPHISPAAAEYQVRRVARARGIPEARVRALLGAHIERRELGVLGEPRVNVLLLNLALDEVRE